MEDISLFGNSASELGSFALVVAISVVTAFIVRRFVKKHLEAMAKSTSTKLDDLLVEGLLGPAAWLIIVIGVKVGKDGLVLSEVAALWFERILTILSITILFIVVIRFFKGVLAIIAENYLKRLGAELTEEELRERVRSVERVTRQITEIGNMLLFILAALTLLTNMGVDVKAIWASLGIGGIAIVVAVKDPLTNVVGRLYIFSTGIFDEGHFIEFDKWSGTVQRIGVFRTSLELFTDMTTLTIPNAAFIQKPVKNYFGRTKFMFKWDLDLPYEVEAGKVAELVKALKEHILGKAEVNGASTWIYLAKLGDHSKVVRVWFQANLPDWATSLHYGSDTLGEIQGVFAEQGVEFAFPTQTVHLDGLRETGEK